VEDSSYYFQHNFGREETVAGRREFSRRQAAAGTMRRDSRLDGEARRIRPDQLLAPEKQFIHF
jgi:hypothetical protein